MTFDKRVLAHRVVSPDSRTLTTQMQQNAVLDNLNRLDPRDRGSVMGVVTGVTTNPQLYTLHPTPYTLHPTPYTLHPTPHTLNPKP